MTTPAQRPKKHRPTLILWFQKGSATEGSFFQSNGHSRLNEETVVSVRPVILDDVNPRGKVVGNITREVVEKVNDDTANL